MTATMAPHLTATLLAEIPGWHEAAVVATEPGRVAGVALVDPSHAPFAVGSWRIIASEGDWVAAGDPLIEITGTASQIGAAEDYVVGHLGFAGGVAIRCSEIRAACPPGLALVCGGWKKLPAALKPALRAGLAVAGVRPRLLDGDFVYVPKNTVALFGGLERAVSAAVRASHGPVAVQVADVAGTWAAIRAGATAVMVDTGRIDDLAAVDQSLRHAGVRRDITVAFGGGVAPEALAHLRTAGADVVDIGRAVLNAPLWDLRVEVRP